ncbi:MAG: PH domain-containing protein [Planctomycetes bacterium]|nr:PH domain-containing protein [Planctomycetota bacterium]
MPASRYGGLIFCSVAGALGFLVLSGVVALGKLPILVYLLLVTALLVVTGLGLTLAWLWPQWEHARAGYRIRPDRIESWSGVLWRRSVSVPISRVQYTDVRQGPLQRRHGFATLVVHTAGTLSSDIAFQGLPPGLANDVRDWLVAQTGSDAV